MEETGRNPIYYDYFPRLFPDLFPHVYAEVQDKCTRTRTQRNGKSYPSPRASCVVADDAGTKSGYGSLTVYAWTEVPVLQRIRETLQSTFDCSFDYTLVHIYETGADSISWHADREALNSTIASASFGAARKFRLKKIGAHGVEKEFRLVSGDVVMMWGPGEKNALGCQRVYKHCVPKERTVQLPRINLTFRQYEE